MGDIRQYCVAIQPASVERADGLFWLDHPADVLLGLAFLALAALSLSMVRRQPGQYSTVMVLLGLVAALAGVAHFAAAMTWVTPVAQFSAVLKLATAMVAWIAVLTFIDRRRQESWAAVRQASPPATEDSSRARDRLRAEERFRRVLDAAPDAMLIVQPDGAIVQVNAQTEKLFGYTQQELLGKPAELLVPERFRDSAAAGNRSGYYTRPGLGAPKRQRTLYGLRKDGSEFPVEISLHPLNTEDGAALLASSIRDVSERVRLQEAQARQLLELAQAQDALKQQTTILQSILDSMGDGVIVADQTGKILCFNPAAEYLLGMGPLSATPDQWTEQHGLYLPDGVTPYPALDFPLARAMRGEAVDGAEIFVRPTGALVGAWLLASARPLRDETGSLRGGVAVFRDITGRMKGEQALRQQTERMALLQLAAMSANCAASAEDALQVCLDGICRHTGWPVGHVFLVSPEGSLTSAQLWHLDDPPRRAALPQATQRPCVPTELGPIAAVLGNGRPQWVEDLARVEHFPRGAAARQAGLHTAVYIPVMAGTSVVALMEFYSGQTLPADRELLLLLAHVGTQLGRAIERERAGQALRQNEELSRSIIATANDAFVAIDERGAITDWNQQAETTFGWSLQEVLGRPLAELIVPEEQRAAHRAGLEEYLKTGTGPILNRRVEVMARNRAGQLFPAELTVWPVRVGRAVRFNAFVHDITPRRRAEERLRDFTSRLEQSNRELQDFASVASHDLQEPLRKIQAFGDRLRTKCSAALDEPGRDYLDRMQNAASRMRSLIDDLLAFSRVSSKAQPFVPVDLNGVAQEVLSDLEVRVQQSGGTVEVDSLPTIDADPLQMRQLLQNLIGNGLKFHRQEEPPAIRIRARLVHGSGSGASNGTPRCELSVADNGIGFDMKYHERLFHVFQRLHGRGEYEGTGMGLAICRRIAERHGGAIVAEGQPGRGATFTVTLPIKQATAEART